MKVSHSRKIKIAAYRLYFKSMPSMIPLAKKLILSWTIYGKGKILLR
jgi:hypothetical protein